MLRVYEVGGDGTLTAAGPVADALGLGRHGRIRLWVVASNQERAAGAELVLAHAWPARADGPVVAVGADGLPVVGRMRAGVPVWAGCGWVVDAGGCLCPTGPAR